MQETSSHLGAALMSGGVGREGDLVLEKDHRSCSRYTSSLVDESRIVISVDRVEENSWNRVPSSQSLYWNEDSIPAKMKKMIRIRNRY